MRRKSIKLIGQGSERIDKQRALIDSIAPPLLTENACQDQNFEMTEDCVLSVYSSGLSENQLAPRARLIP